MIRKNFKKYLSYLSAILIFSSLVYAIFSIISVPERITIYENQKLNLNKLYSIKLVNKTGVLSDDKITQQKLPLKKGEYDANLNLFGINVKSVRLNVINTKELIPSGRCIGINLKTDGLLVVGISDFERIDGVKVSPCKNVNIRTGDVVKKANGKILTSTNELKEMIENLRGEKIELEILRNEKYHKVNVRAQLDKLEGAYKIGLWLRDSTAGIGTMTYIDPNDKSFASLGHGITDSDTGKLIPSGKGVINDATVFSVKKGRRGEPGELQGVFLTGEGKKGEILCNTPVGIFGKVDDIREFTSGNPIPIGLKNEVREGEAYIICDVDDQKTETFTIEIEKINSDFSHTSKGMIIRITDKKLLQKTGGIVQGMSGSPIVQNGKLIGAVTHVFVNDPTRGYGIFIENMLAEAEKIK